MLPTTATAGSASTSATIGRNQPGVGSVSLLRKSRYLPAAIAAPWFDARANPRLAVLRVKRMLSRRDNSCAVSSLEALSMTITSWATSRVFSATAIRHFRVSSHLLKTGMTIETVGVVVAGSTRARAFAKCVPPIRRDCASMRAGHFGDEGVRNPVTVTKVT